MSSEAPVNVPVDASLLDEGDLPSVIQMHPKAVILALSKLPHPDKSKSNKPLIAEYLSRSAWGALTEVQRNKIVAAWKSLPETDQTRIADEIKDNVMWLA